MFFFVFYLLGSAQSANSPSYCYSFSAFFHYTTRISIRMLANLYKRLTITNQRTNGPVNAHLISGPTGNTKTNKIGQSQPRVIMFINFVELESPMIHAKFQDQWTSGLEKKIFKGFYHIWAWRPSWLCELNHLHKLSFPLPKEDSCGIWH